MAYYNPQFPNNPVDGMQVLDAFGNIYQFRSAEQTWEYIGIIQAAQTVNATTNGVVPPDVYAKIQQLQNLISSGVAFDKNKIFIGKNNNSPYYYYFYSSNDLITFEPFKTSGAQKLRIEVNRQKLMQLLTATPCIGPTGLKGPIGNGGRNGIKAPLEKLQVPSTISDTHIKINSKVPTPINTDISLRIYVSGTQIIEISIDPITSE